MRSKLLLASLSFSLLSHSQDSSFQLKDYKYRTEGYRSLSLFGSMGGSISQYSYDDPSYSDDSYSQFDFLPLAIGYYSTYNRDNRIHFTNMSLSGRYSTSRHEVDKAVLKRKYLPASFTWENNDLFYKGKRFFEFGMLASNGFSHENNSDTIGHIKNTTESLNTTVILGYGRGRIENVRDAQMAIFILNDLQDQGLLPANIEAQTYQELASLITQINNKRIFDNRRRRIYELTQIDSFIKSKGLVSTTDIRHFTVINDNWSLAFNPLRLAGKSWYVHLEPGAGFEYENRDYDLGTASQYEYNSKFVTAGAEAGFEQYIPANLHWQHSWRISVSVRRNWNYDKTKSVDNGQTSKSEYWNDGWRSQIGGSYQLDFYPNNRTILSTYLGASMVHNSQYDYEESLNVIPSFGFSTSYFLGYRTRLNLSASFSNNHLHSKNGTVDYNTDQLSANLNLGFEHTIF